MGWQSSGVKIATRSAVRFPLQLALHLQTENGLIEARTRDISSNGLLFVGKHLPAVGTSIEFTMDMPSAVMGSEHDVSIHCMGRIVRRSQHGDESIAAAVIDEYFLKA